MQIIKEWYNTFCEYSAGFPKHHIGSRLSHYDSMYSLCFLLSGKGAEIYY